MREVNAEAALVASDDSGLSVLAAEFDGERVVAVRIMVNQDKVGHLIST